MGRLPVKASVAVGRLLHRRRRELGWSLQETSDRLFEDKNHRIPPSTLAKIERGRLDPGVRRLHYLLSLLGIPSPLIADLVEIENLTEGVEVDASVPLETLYKEGTKHWKSGNVAKGMAYLLAVWERSPTTIESKVLRQKAMQSSAVAVRNLGKFNLAHHIMTELLCEPPDPSLIVPVLLLGASTFRGLGATAGALAFANYAEDLVDPDNHQDVAWVLHQKATLLLESGELEEADKTAQDAVKAYRRLSDRYGEVRALVLRARVAEESREIDGAIRYAKQVISLSKRHRLGRALVYGYITLGHLRIVSGATAKGTELLNLALSEAVAMQDSNAEFLAHYHLWKAHSATGDSDRAEFELHAASFFVRKIDDKSPEADEIRKLIKEGKRKS